jgi:glucosamine 6-phosphate synthetase-like amidotransferase/phosphosugar isomerase protein
MCGIFGTTEKDRFATLYNLNRTRGDFAFGCCFITDTKSIQYVHHQPGILDFDSGLFSPNISYFYMLGHTQAPTSSQRTFNKYTSHPFEHEDWVVAHNGVLSNYEHLKEKYLPDHSNPVDSSIIPALLTQLHDGEECDTIKEVLELLEGTYSVWIFNIKSKNIYIARCGSTLYVDRLNSEFSSTKTEGMEEFPDNSLSIITSEGITNLTGFDGNSPFLII